MENIAFRMKFFIHLSERFGKIANEGATDATGVHFGNVHTSVLKETAINADFAKFVFNQNNLLADICFFEKFFYQCGFSCTEEA